MSQINNTRNKSYKDYFKNPSTYTFNFRTIDVDPTRNIIDRLNSKSSCGKEGLTVIKIFFTCEAVTLIINQSIKIGIFPNNLKLAKAIPLF